MRDQPGKKNHTAENRGVVNVDMLIGVNQPINSVMPDADAMQSLRGRAERGCQERGQTRRQ